MHKTQVDQVDGSGRFRVLANEISRPSQLTQRLPGILGQLQTLDVPLERLLEHPSFSAFLSSISALISSKDVETRSCGRSLVRVCAQRWGAQLDLEVLQRWCGTLMGHVLVRERDGICPCLKRREREREGGKRRKLTEWPTFPSSPLPLTFSEQKPSNTTHISPILLESLTSLFISTVGRAEVQSEMINPNLPKFCTILMDLFSKPYLQVGWVEGGMGGLVSLSLSLFPG